MLKAGTRLDAGQVALALGSGHSRIAVGGSPRVALFDSGDELAVGSTNEAHNIPASNAAMLATMLPCTAASASRMGVLEDRLEAVLDGLRAASDADLIVTSGGASVGDRDLVKPALEAWGAKIDFWRVAIKPGKPLLVATRERGDGQRPQLVLGLPGNPVSAFVTAYLFLLPLVRHLGGARNPFPAMIETQLAAPCPANGPRRTFLRAHWDGLSVAPVASQDSGALSALAQSNALIDRVAGADAAQAGDSCRIYPLQNGGIA